MLIVSVQRYSGKSVHLPRVFREDDALLRCYRRCETGVFCSTELPLSGRAAVPIGVCEMNRHGSRPLTDRGPTVADFALERTV